ncbi:MAG: ABC transporter permease [Cellulomonas sp.]
MSQTVAEQRIQRLAELELRPVGPQPGFVSGTWSSITDIWQQRELLGLLVSRELRARYKDSSLGFVWSLLRPIAQLVIYFVVIGKFLGAARGIPEFAVFVFCGLTIWSVFNEIVAGGTGSIVANAGLIKKVYLPREIFPLSSVGGAMVNFAIQLVVLLVGTLIVGSFPLTATVLYAPAALILVVTFATALALLLGALNVYLRDVQHLIEIIMLILFWASPIVYSFKYVSDVLQGNWLEQVYLANPVTLAVLGFQRGIWVAGADQPYPPQMPLRIGVALVVSLFLLWLFQRVFARLEGNFAQEL